MWKVLLFFSIWEISYIINYWTNYYLIFSKILQILEVAIEVFFFSFKKFSGF